MSDRYERFAVSVANAGPACEQQAFGTFASTRPLSTARISDRYVCEEQSAPRTVGRRGSWTVKFPPEAKQFELRDATLSPVGT